MDIPYILPELPGSVQVDGFGLVGVSDFVPDTVPAQHWVQLLPWSEYSARPDALARHATMARSLGRLTTIDTPGIGYLTSNLTPGLRRDIRRGNLKGVSEIQWEALREATSESLGPISLLGYSMGTPLVASLLREKPDDIAVERVTLVEPVANNSIRLGFLSGHLLHNSFTRPDYRKTNPDWYRALPHPLPPQTRDLHTYAAMIARGEQFMHVEQFEGTSNSVISCDESDVSPLREVSYLARRLHAEQTVIQGENHSFIDNLGNMAWLSSYISNER